MARPADLLAKANADLARTAKARRLLAGQQKLAAKHQRELALAAKALEQTAKPRQVLAEQQKVIAETQKLRAMMFEGHKRTRRLIKLAQLTLIRRRVTGGSRQARPHVSHRARQGRRCAGRPAGQRTSSRGSPSGLAGGGR